MRIVILTVDHPYANKVVKKVLRKFKKDVVLIIESGVLYPNKSLSQALKKYLEASGLYYVLAQVIKLEIYRLFSKAYTPLFPNNIDNKFYSYKALAKKFRAESGKMRNVNNPEELAKLKRLKPELIVSVFFNQILKSEIINLPKKGIINVHPAHLPDYKGVSPVFWVLANGEREAGVSVHYIDEGVDTGRIIKRKKVKIRKGDTEDSLYSRCVALGIPLLLESIKEIESGGVRTISNKGGRYFSLPTRKAVRELKRRGSGFFNIREFLFSP